MDSAPLHSFEVPPEKTLQIERPVSEAAPRPQRRRAFGVILGTTLLLLLLTAGALAAMVWQRSQKTPSLPPVTTEKREADITSAEESTPSAQAQASPALQPPTVTRVTPSPRPTAAPGRANIRVDSVPELIVSTLIEDEKQPNAPGHLTNGNGFTFYYRRTATDMTTGALGMEPNAYFRLKEGEILQTTFKVKNDSTTPSPATQARVLINNTQSSEQTIRSFDLPPLAQLDYHYIQLTSSELLFEPGKYEVIVLLDPENRVEEEQENDNAFRFSYEVTADTTAPFLEITRAFVNKSDTQVCLDYRAVFPRDDQDATRADGPSVNTQLRFWRSDTNAWTNWVPNSELAKKFSQPECLPLESASPGTTRIQVQDKRNNVTDLSVTY